MSNLLKIQQWMKKNSKDIFIVNRTDEFLSEYIAPYAERLNWLSNFSGSAGRAIIEKNKAFIFVDGRYTYQVVEEVNSNEFKIKKLKEYWSHLEKYSNQKKNISIVSNLHSIFEIEKMKKLFKDSNVWLDFLDINPIDCFWNNQPKRPKSIAFIHEKKFSGESSKSKILKIQKILRSNSLDFYILSSLDSIAWILNLRGNDVKYTPLVFCLLIITNKGKLELFIEKNKIKKIKKKLKLILKINSFGKIQRFIESIDKNKVIAMDEMETTYHLKNICIKNNLRTINYSNPCLYYKAEKNLTELKGARKSNLRDGVSISKFLHWIKEKIIIEKTSELSAANRLHQLRKKNKLFYSLSFDTISAFSFHAALPHYRVSNNSNIFFKNNSIYLVDSGAQYRDGTTDITRTIILGKATPEQKDRFTRVLKGHIAIARTKFRKGTKGYQLDSLARKYLKDIGCDYDHGTGHGVGSFLSVHEGPQRISKFQGQKDSEIKEGMILSNEPGYYKKGKYGIRIENLIVCCKEKNFLYFETISWAPIDLDLIDFSLLNSKEISWINNYHKKVCKYISPYLDKSEKEWLSKVTKPVIK